MTSGLEAVRGLVEEIAHQKPEKPDYWNSCSQCERNIDAAQEALAALPTPPADAEQRARELLSEQTGKSFCTNNDGETVCADDAIAVIAAALAQQPEALGVVDEAMVERACGAFGEEYGGFRVSRVKMRAALTAALTGERNG